MLVTQHTVSGRYLCAGYNWVVGTHLDGELPVLQLRLHVLGVNVVGQLRNTACRHARPDKHSCAMATDPEHAEPNPMWKMLQGSVLKGLDSADGTRRSSVWSCHRLSAFEGCDRAGLERLAG